VNTAAAQTHRSHVIIPGEKIEGNLVRIPALSSAVNSVANCDVVAVVSCNGCNPGMHPDKSANSFLFQQIGNDTDDGKVLAYGPKDLGVAGSTRIRRAALIAFESPSSFMIVSKSGLLSVATKGFTAGEKR
jgi:hypothetical protein